METVTEKIGSRTVNSQIKRNRKSEKIGAVNRFGLPIIPKKTDSPGNIDRFRQLAVKFEEKIGGMTVVFSKQRTVPTVSGSEFQICSRQSRIKTHPRRQNQIGRSDADIVGIAVRRFKTDSRLKSKRFDCQSKPIRQ